MIIEATGSIAICQNSQLKALKQTAMREAILDCLAKGITDPILIRQAQIEASKNTKF